MNAPAKSLLVTPDCRYLVVRGRLWRMSNPDLPADERQRIVTRLMKARSDVGRALKASDDELLRDARRRVHAAKVALGERGPVWWDDGSPDLNRKLVHNTPYHFWYETATTPRPARKRPAAGRG